MKKILLLALFTSGCAQSISPNSYNVGQVGSVNRAVQGIIVSVREVNVDRSTGVGGAAGAGIGAAGGAALGNNASGSVAGAIAGAVVGGVVGAAAEKGAVKAKGYEYVVKTRNGALLTLVQGEPALPPDAQVIVIYGSPARIILDQSTSMVQ